MAFFFNRMHNVPVDLWIQNLKVIFCYNCFLFNISIVVTHSTTVDVLKQSLLKHSIRVHKQFLDASSGPDPQ